MSKTEVTRIDQRVFQFPMFLANHSMVPSLPPISTCKAILNNDAHPRQFSSVLVAFVTELEITVVLKENVRGSEFV